VSNRRKINPPQTRIRVLGVVTEYNEDPDLVLFRGTRISDGAPVTFHVRGAGAAQMTARLAAGDLVEAEIPNS
jgi:hypothetical protein